MEKNKSAVPAGGTDNERNTRIYNELREIPSNALKPITDGRLKGKSDINTQWRIKRLTEVFGPQGFGWRYDLLEERIERADEYNAAAFVRINLFVKHPDTGEWSAAIPGTGGNVFKRMENSGKVYVDDDCFKKALSDAIGTAARGLGLAADVYFDNDVSKYSGQKTGTSAGTQRSKAGSGGAGAGKAKPAMRPGSPFWYPSVARAASLPDDAEAIRERIEAKYSITDEDFALLMRQAGKETEPARRR